MVTHSVVSPGGLSVGMRTTSRSSSLKDEDFQREKIEEAKSAVDMALLLGSPLIRAFGWQTYETEKREPMFAA